MPTWHRFPDRGGKMQSRADPLPCQSSSYRIQTLSVPAPHRRGGSFCPKASPDKASPFPQGWLLSFGLSLEKFGNVSTKPTAEGVGTEQPQLPQAILCPKALSSSEENLKAPTAHPGAQPRASRAAPLEQNLRRSCSGGSPFPFPVPQLLTSG